MLHSKGVARSVFAVGVLYLLVPGVAYAQAGLPYIEEEPEPETTKPEAEAPAPTPAADAEPPPPSEPVTPRVATQPQIVGLSPGDLYTLWERRLEHLHDGRLTDADAVLAELTEKKSDSGWPNSVSIGLAVSDEALETLAAGQLNRSMRLAEAARLLAPAQPATHLAYARVAWEQGSIGGSLGGLVEGFRRSWADPWSLRMRMSNMAVGLALSVLVASFLFALASVYRHFRSVRYALVHPTGLSRFQAAIVVIAALLAPVLLGLGVVFVLLVWSVIAAAFYSPRERIAAGLVVGYLAAIPLLLPLVLGPLSYTGSRAHDAYLAATDIEAEAAAARLAAHPNPRPGEQFILGLRALWSGDVEGASSWLNRAEQAGERGPELLVSLGNVEFTRGNLDAAAKAYRAALDANPSNVMALFNLSRLRFSQTELAEAGELHRLASETDYALVQRWDEEQKRIGPTYVVKPNVPLDVLHQSHPGHEETTNAAADVWYVLGGGVEPMVFVATAAVGFLYVLLSIALYRRGEHKRSKTQPLERIRLEIEVHRHQARIERLRRVVAVVFAGAGQLIGGRSLLGLLFATTFCACLLVVLTTVDLLPLLVPHGGGPRAAAIITASGAAIACYVLALLDNLKAEG